MSPSRRRALQLVVLSSVPSVGCLERSGGKATPTESESPSITPTDTTSGAPTGTVLPLGESFEAPDGTTVTVNTVRLRRLVRSTSVGSSSHLDVAWLEGYQFAVADVKVSGPRTELGSEVPLALDVDGTRYPLSDQHWYWTYPPGTHIGNTTRRRPAYPAPIADAANASIVWVREQPVRWQLPEETVAELSRAPSFGIRSVTVPDSVTRGSSFEASFTVRNSGADGRFVAEFGAGPISDHGEVAVTVPADGERTYNATMQPHYTEQTSAVEVTLGWGKERLRRTVSVE